MHIKGIHIAILTLIVISIGAWWGIQSIQASIDYWLEKPDSFVKGTFPNSIHVYCENGGQTDGDFYLIVTFINASFSNQTAKPYTQVDDSTVSFRFLLHKDDPRQEPIVYFTIHENVEGFSVQLSLEKANPLAPMSINPRYPTSLQYQWNDQTKNFRVIE